MGEVVNISLRLRRACAFVVTLSAMVVMLVLNAQPAQATLWWDDNGATGGAGATPSGTWSAAGTQWTATSAGTVATVGWTANEKARFAAGSDAVNAYTVTVSGTIGTIEIGLEETGAPTFTGGILNFTHVAAAVSILTGVNGTATNATINSQISGTAGFKVARNSGLGSVITIGSTANNFTGGFQVNGDNTVRLGASEVIPNANVVTLANATGAGVLDLNGFTETVIGLASAAGSGSVTLGGGTLILNAPTGQSWGGVISEAGNVTKNGSGTQTFTNSNTYTGLTTITAGVLEMGASNIFANTSTMTINGATAVLDMNTSQTDTIGTVTLAGGGSINGTTSTLTTGGNFEMQSGTVNVVLAGASRPLNKTTAGTVTLNASNTYTGLTSITAGTLTYGIANAISTGAVTVNGATAILNLGASHNDSVGIVTLDGGGAINGTSTLTSTGTFEMKSGTVAAILGGNLIPLNKTTAGTVTLNNANTYTGLTNITAGTLAYGVSNAIASGPVTVNGATAILSMGANHPDTVGTVTVDGGASITGSGTSVLTSTGSFEMKSGTVGVGLAGPGIKLNKTTAASMTLTGDDTFSGDTNVNGGLLILAAAGSGQALGGTSDVAIDPTATLQLGADDEINNAAAMSLDGGTFNTGGFDEGAPSVAGVGILSMTASSIIDLDGGSSILAFADSSSASWAGTLSVYNWSGNIDVGGGIDQLYFDASSSGLSSGQLGQIVFYSDAGVTPLGFFNQILSTGEVVPSTPEPASLALLGCGGLMMLRRRRAI